MDNINILDAIKFLDDLVPNPTEGLPDEIFYYISRTTPLINVDLLIKDELDRTLLAWRDDKYSTTGWHIPGGIIRHQETMETRIEKVALSEIGTKVKYDKTHIALNEMIHKERKDRSHFISILFDCFLSNKYEINGDGKESGTVGFLKWHDECPNNIIKYHEVYRELI